MIAMRGAALPAHAADARAIATGGGCDAGRTAWSVRTMRARSDRSSLAGMYRLPTGPGGGALHRADLAVVVIAIFVVVRLIHGFHRDFELRFESAPVELVGELRLRHVAKALEAVLQHPQQPVRIPAAFEFFELVRNQALHGTISIQAAPISRLRAAAFTMLMPRLYHCDFTELLPGSGRPLPLQPPARRSNHQPDVQTQEPDMVRMAHLTHRRVIPASRDASNMRAARTENQHKRTLDVTKFKLIGTLMAALFAAHTAHAAIDLIAIGSISGQYEDFALQTAGALENGAAGNMLGGLGSGLAFAGENTFIAVPDRGPNAVSYNGALDDTASYITRFQTLHLSLAPSAPGSALPFTLTSMLTGTTLLASRSPLVYGSGAGLGVGSGAPALNSRHTHYFTGRSDNFDPGRPSTYSGNGRFDPEGVRVSNDGKSLFISDEYGPYVYQFDRESGLRTRVFELPAKFAVTHLRPVGDDEISGNTAGRVANKGMEGLAITPDGKSLVGAMQSPLIQDGGTDAPCIRVVRIDIQTGATREYAYGLTNIGTAAKPKYPTVSEIVAINDHEFLLDERDGKGQGDGSVAVVKKLYRIDLDGAQDVSGISGAANLAARAVSKTLFLDVVAKLNASGILSTDIPAKLEGVAFGPDVVINGVTKHTLFIANDNDFTATVGGVDNPNRFIVFAFDGNDLPAFLPQRFRVKDERSREDDDKGR